MRKTEDIEIDGEMYTVRPLNVSEVLAIANMYSNSIMVIPYMVMAATIDPKFETIDDIPLNAVVLLSQKIQELTLAEMEDIAVPIRKEEDDLPSNSFIV